MKQKFLMAIACFAFFAGTSLSTKSFMYLNFIQDKYGASSKYEDRLYDIRYIESLGCEDFKPILYNRITTYKKDREMLLGAMDKLKINLYILVSIFFLFILLSLINYLSWKRSQQRLKVD
ncbi:hypothetical protein [Gayadomonas joobiniege]|uniref:hypothetical protein n=1 Tax=Gayadomonas joobiniege TaxID=1234606 RepID=UPI0003601B23|nr:hypothetical protein [Gayadomonas joobiniege]